MKKEDYLQIAVADYLRMQYPKVLFTHVANERQTSKMRGYKLKRMGVRAGMSDTLIFKSKYSNGSITPDYVGLAIELKIEPNKPTKEQLEVLKQLFDNGWKTAVCYSFDEAKEIIDNYLK
jgi:hypothetical protein